MCCEPGLSAIGLLLTTCLLRTVNRRLYAANSLTAKIQNERAFCKKKREFLPTILRSENFALKVAKPFVPGRFSQGRKRSEMGRKIFENAHFFSFERHLKQIFLLKRCFLINATNATKTTNDKTTNRVFEIRMTTYSSMKIRRDKNICIYILYYIYIIIYI